MQENRSGCFFQNTVYDNIRVIMIYNYHLLSGLASVHVWMHDAVFLHSLAVCVLYTHTTASLPRQNNFDPHSAGRLLFDTRPACL